LSARHDVRQIGVSERAFNVHTHESCKSEEVRKFTTRFGISSLGLRDQICWNLSTISRQTYIRITEIKEVSTAGSPVTYFYLSNRLKKETRTNTSWTRSRW